MTWKRFKKEYLTFGKDDFKVMVLAVFFYVVTPALVCNRPYNPAPYHWGSDDIDSLQLKALEKQDSIRQGLHERAL